MYKLSQLENIGVKFRELLEEAGIQDQEQLLNACQDRSGLQTLADQTGINPKLILMWTSQADLNRISGIGTEYAELLAQIGILSVQKLAQYDPAKLLIRLQEENDKKKLVGAIPSESSVESWIDQAKKLPVIIEF